MLERLDRLPTDPILGLMSAFRADTAPRKIDLGVGVYRDERGDTPILDAVRMAEQVVLAAQISKTYVAPAGNPGFNAAMERLVLGDAHPVIGTGRLKTIQSVGGCGALRLGAELIRIARGETTIHVSDPTWANHVPLLGGARLMLERYPYFDPETRGVRFDAMYEALERLEPQTLVLLHASCHNPSGADLSLEEWDSLLGLFQRRGLVPFIDMAYQGLGTGIAEDAYGPRRFAEELPECLIAVSCSKNFGLYRERVGALHVVTTGPAAAEAALSQLVRTARTLYSMPPDHGAAIVHQILSTPALRAQWEQEVGVMRARISGLRRDVVHRLSRRAPAHDFSFIERQQGMFSFLGLTVAQVHALRERHHVYMTDDSRINIAGLRSDNLDDFVQALASVLQG